MPDRIDTHEQIIARYRAGLMPPVPQPAPEPAEACACGEPDCMHHAFGYPYCPICQAHTRPHNFDEPHYPPTDEITQAVRAAIERATLADNPPRRIVVTAGRHVQPGSLTIAPGELLLHPDDLTHLRSQAHLKLGDSTRDPAVWGMPVIHQGDVINGHVQ